MKLAELKKLAAKHNIVGRSKMNKAQLEKALSRVRHSRKQAKKKSRKPANKSRKSVKKKSRKPAKKKFIIMCDYTDKSLVLLGSTYAHKEEIKKAGGKYNPNLSVGKGWVFPKTKKKTVEKLVKKMRSAPAKSRKAVKKSRRKKAKKSSRKSSRKYKKKFRMKKGNCLQDCQGSMCLLGGKKRYHNIYYTGANQAKFCSPGLGVTQEQFTISEQGQIVDPSNCANPSKYARGHACHDLEYEKLGNWNRRFSRARHRRHLRTIKNVMKESQKAAIKTVNSLLKEAAEEDTGVTTGEDSIEFLEAANQIGNQKAYNDYFDLIMTTPPVTIGDLRKDFLKKVLEAARKVSPENAKDISKNMLNLFQQQVKEGKEEDRRLEKEYEMLS